MMQTIRTSALVNVRLNLGVFLMSVLMVSVGNASTKEHKMKKPENAAQVVAHISFSGLAVVDMAMQRKADDKYYIYVQHAKDEGVSIIDVSKPSQAKTLGVISWPDPAASSRMNVTGNLAVIAESQMLPMRSSTSNDDLVLWDLSNPAAPRVVKRFTGVVKWLQDERNFIYVLNGDGLWVVSEPVETKPEVTAPSTYPD
jgi:hypothetical protein